MSGLEQEEQALNDIAAKPKVSKKPASKRAESEHKRADASKENKAAKPEKPVDTDLEPNEIETAAGSIMAKTFDEIKVTLGGTTDKDFSILVGRGFSVLFSGVRVATASPLAKAGILFGALGFSFVPDLMRFFASKSEQEEGKDNAK